MKHKSSAMRKLLPFNGCGHGFTLIELLVVIAIIAVLAAILFPVFAKARESAKKSACANNLKQLASAMLQYVQDYDERFPGRDVGGLHWRTLILPYIKNVQVFKCPSNPSTTADAQGIVANYAINNAGNQFPSGGSRLISDFQDPARVILFCELRNQGWNDYGSNWWTSVPGSWVNGYAGHNSTWNLAFIDGHVKALRPTQTADPINMWPGWTSNPNIAVSNGWGGTTVGSPTFRDAMKALEDQFP